MQKHANRYIKAVSSMGCLPKKPMRQYFGGTNELYTLRSLPVLISKLSSMDGGELSQFLSGPTSRKAVAGRKRKYSGDVVEKLVELRKEESTATLKSIVDKFQQHYSDEKSLQVPSHSTFSRLYRRANIFPNATTVCPIMH